VKADTKRFLADLAKRHSRLYARNVSEMVVAKALGRDESYNDARDRLLQTARETFGIAELLGARSVLQRAYPVAKRLGFADGPEPSQDLVPRVTFREALDNFVARTPVVLKDAAERTAQAISDAYSSGNVVGFVRSAEDAVTEKAQQVISRAIEQGSTEVQVGRNLVEQVEAIRELAEPWSEAYARMAFRTNVNTAVTAGRFRQVQDPDVRDLMPAFQFQAISDSDVRHNHAAADGLIFSVANPVWNFLAPPLGYNCRCTIRPVSVMQLRRQGRINEDGTIREDTLPSDAGPDEGFRSGRGDISTGLVL
jgi:SPP1 gp7 family putative phage head morphogenesis protein